MTIAEFVLISRRSWRWLAAFLVAGIVAGGMYGLLAPKVYTSTASGFVASHGVNVFGGTQGMMQQAASYLPLITSKEVREQIASHAHVPVASLQGRLTADMGTSGTLINVTATASTPDSALTLANGALQALAVVIKQVEAKAGVGDEKLTVIPMQNAVAPTAPTTPDVRKALLVGAVGGIVAGYLLLFLRRSLDSRLRSGKELAELTDSALIGRIPRLSSDDVESSLLADAGEPLREVRTGLRFAGVDAPVRSLVVTSANPSEGKSTIAIALARLMAATGERTLLIDGDLRRPAISKMLGLDGRVGLSEVLIGQLGVADGIRPSSFPGLSVLPAGRTPPNPSEMLGSETMRMLLQSLAEDYVLVIDSPPLLPVSDGLLMGANTNGILFVAASGKTRKADVTAAYTKLRHARIHTLGVVLNMVPPRDTTDGQSYYTQYRGYYATSQPADANAPEPAVVDVPPAHEVTPAHRPRTRRRRDLV